MNIRTGVVHPLSVLGSSSRPISTIEQRQFLYDQERQLEKIVRTNQGLSNIVQSYVSSRVSQVNYVLDPNLKNGIDDLGIEISEGMYGINNGLKLLNDTQLDIFREKMKALGIINGNITSGFSMLTQQIGDSFNELLIGIQSQTTILSSIYNQIGDIINTLKNPRKIEGHEYKKDAIDYLTKGWYQEALEYLYLAADKLTSDQEVYYLIGIIEFEERKDYLKAIENLEKSRKYAQGYGDNNIYIQSLDKLASIYFILCGNGDKSGNEKIKIAFEYQLEAVTLNTRVNQNHIYDLLKYSASLGEYEIFEKYLYVLLRLNPTFLFEISNNFIITSNDKLIQIIDIVIDKIKDENYREDLDKTKNYILSLQQEIAGLEKKNGIEGKVLYIDGGIIVIGNLLGEITGVINYNIDYSKIFILKLAMLNIGGLKFVQRYDDNLNTFYTLSDGELDENSKISVLFVDSKLRRYHSTTGNISEPHINDEHILRVFDKTKPLMDGFVTKFKLPNDTKVDKKSQLKVLLLGERVNFIQPNGELMLGTDVSEKLKIKHSELDKIINESLVEHFDSKGIGKIRIMNECYTVCRRKSLQGFFHYKISF